MKIRKINILGIITRLISVLYVIPLYAIVGDYGGSLLGYANGVFLLFASVFVFVPDVIRTITFEYQTLGYYKVKNRAFSLAKKISIALGYICFIIVFLLAPFISRGIGSTSSSNITFVIRMLGLSLVFIPLVEVYLGYLSGHHFDKEVKFAKLLVQLIGIIVLVGGSYLTLKVIKLKIALGIGFTLISIVIGVIVAYFYLVNVFLKNKNMFIEKIRDVNEPIVTNKILIKKIVSYSLPFFVVGIMVYLYNTIDMFSVVRGLVKYAKMDSSAAEAIYGIMAVWTSQFKIIMFFIVTVIMNNVSFDRKKQKNKNVSQGINMFLYLAIPISLITCFFAKPIWILFYGENIYGPSILAYQIIGGLIEGFLLLLLLLLKEYKEYKNAIICLSCGVLLKFVFNISLLRTFIYFGLPPYYGFITATILGYLFSSIMILMILHYKYKIVFEDVIKNFIDIICGSLLMIIVLLIIKIFIPIYSSVRIVNLLIILVYLLVGSFVYLFYMKKSRATNRILDNKIKNKIGCFYK